MKASREIGRPARTKPGTASAISPTWINRERRHASPSAWPMRFPPTGWLPAASHSSSAAAKRDSMRAGRPRSQGNHSPLEGESQKPSRQAKADAVGGWRATSQKADVLPLETPGCPGAGKRLMTWLHFLNDCAEINKMLNASIQSLSTIHRKVVSRLQASTAMPQH